MSKMYAKFINSCHFEINKIHYKFNEFICLYVFIGNVCLQIILCNCNICVSFVTHETRVINTRSESFTHRSYITNSFAISR